VRIIGLRCYCIWIRVLARKSMELALVLSSFWFALPTHADTMADDVSLGHRLFQQHCAGCHGASGEGGRGPTLALPRLPRAPTNAALMDVIRFGIPDSEMPAAALRSEQIGQVAAYVRKLGQTTSAPLSGNPSRGEQLYFGKGACVQCHAIKGHGSTFGPDLSEIGLQRGAAHLRRSLIDPAADVPKSFAAYRSQVSIADNFLLVRALAKDGRRIEGVRVNEDSLSIQIREPSGRLHSLFKSELAELHKDWGNSPMPSYRDLFSAEELDDVVAFLASLRRQR